VAAFFETLLSWDATASAAGELVRWEPLTVLFVLVSTWWVKWPLIAACGLAGDACRRVSARATVAALSAVGIAGLVVAALKELFDRARPPIADPTLDPIGVIPASASFPSGHAATAFAAAVAVGLVHPRLRRPLLALAALVALSRVYLGVHYVLDVLAGTLLGVGCGAAGAWVARAVERAPTAPAPSLVRHGTSSALLHRSPV
jgi:undecaprenyl-diphosphatase